MGEWESGRVGEWESGRVGEWENYPISNAQFAIPLTFIRYIRYIRYIRRANPLPNFLPVSNSKKNLNSLANFKKRSLSQRVVI